jgi:iron(III) transport system ATP-binding protein
VLTVRNLVKTFADGRRARERVLAVNDISLDVPQGQLFTLLGPSGCGKTTTLRSVAGLEKPDTGVISVAGRTLFDSSQRVNVPANRRRLGMVFQSYAIWPHMNVFKNVAFPLMVRSGAERMSRKVIAERVDRVLAVVRLDHLRDRQATDLSGGQQQRLALARALVMEPPLLLLDEPLSNLDAKLREEMRFELKRLQRQMDITTIYVTHDQVEALAMSNVIAVMNEGTIEQVGRPRDIYNNPRSHFVADFIGTTNFFSATVEERPGEGSYRVVAPQGSVVVETGAPLRVGDAVTVSIRPEHIQLEAGVDASPGPGVWHGEVVTRAFLGDAVDHQVAVAGAEFRVRCHPTISVPQGTAVTVRLPSEWCAVIPADE